MEPVRDQILKPNHCRALAVGRVPALVGALLLGSEMEPQSLGVALNDVGHFLGSELKISA